MSNPTKQAVVDKAQRMLRNPEKYVLWDTETTGLSATDQIIEICAIDCTGAVLVNDRLKPSVPINPRAQEVHKITSRELQGCRCWYEMVDEWEEYTKGKTLLAYNAKFDVRLLTQTYDAFGLHRPKIKGFCAMNMATDYFGAKRKLSGGDHSALGDCFALLDLIRMFARHGQPANPSYDVPGLDAILDELGTAPALPFV